MTFTSKLLTVAVLATLSFNTNAIEATISGAAVHGIVVDRGVVYGFGQGTNGSLGANSILSQQFNPVLVGIDNVKSVATASQWNVALKNDSTVWWWGYNANTRVKNFTPKQIPEFNGATDVAITVNRIVALVNGRVFIYNFIGAPIEVSGGMSNIVEIDAHLNHVMMRTASGQVYTLGSNTVGQLGNGSTATDWSNPSLVLGPNGSPLVNVSKINAGEDFSVAVAGGEVFVWGKNKNGVFGNGDVNTVFTTTAVKSNINGVVDVSAGTYSIQVKRTDGSMWGWGWHNYITGGTYNTSSTPVLLVNQIDKLGQGQGDSTFVTIGGVWNGWGGATNGKLGTGNQTELHAVAALVPLPVSRDITAPVTTAALVCTPTEKIVYVDKIVEVEKIVYVEVIKEVVNTVYEFVKTDFIDTATGFLTDLGKLVADLFDSDKPGYGYGDDNHDHTKEAKS